MKCLVINLDRSPDRLAHVRSTFDGLNVGFERFRAADGEQLPEELLERINARNQWVRPLARAEIGCLLSHQACWEIIATGSQPFGAIFEDDVLVSPHAPALLNSAAWIPEDIDFIKLETRNRAVTVSRRSRRVAAIHELVRLFTFHDGLGGYVVSRRCAEWLCAQVQSRTAPVDQLVLNPKFGIFGRLNVFQLTPAICIPNETARRNDPGISEISSTIDPHGNLYRSDGALLRQSIATGLWGRARKQTERMAAGARRAVSGRRRIVVEYR